MEKEIAVRKKRIYSRLPIPEFLTQEWYDNLKKTGKTDTDIATYELFVSIATFNRWKKKKFIKSKDKNRGPYSKYATIAKENNIPYQNVMRRIYLGWDPMLAATKPVEFRQAK